MLEYIDSHAHYDDETFDSDRDKEIDGFFSRLRMLELTVEHMTGKQGLEMMKN
ncbi:MAG: hypothetical protein IJC04_02430 [Oscillospiraceae bacterium]|nr:hypothetical protein [Oscillospiraceae bacterium]